MFCTACGARRAPDGAFCPFCGAAATVPGRQPQRLDAGEPPATFPGPTGSDLSAAVRHGVAGAVLSVAVLAGVAGALATGFAPAGERGHPLEWCRAAMLMLGLAVHAPAELRLAVTDPELPAPLDLTLGLGVTPLVLTGLLLLVTFVLGRRAERAAVSPDARALLRASAGTAAAFAGTAVLLAGLLVSGIDAGLPRGSTLTAGVDLARLAPGALAVALTGTVLGRAAEHGRAVGVRSGLDVVAGGRGGWAPDLRHVRNLVLGTLVATLAAAAIAVLWVAVHQALVASTLDAFSTQHPVPAPGGQQASAQAVWGGLLSLVALLPGLMVIAAGVALGGPVEVSFDEQGQRALATIGLDVSAEPHLGLFSGGLPSWVYLAWLPLLAVTVLLGIRAELARTPSGPAGAWVWRVPAATSAAWALLAFLAQVSIEGQGSGLLEGPGLRVTAGLQIAGTAVAALLWAGLSVAAGRLARPMAAAVPGIALRLAGPRLEEEWRLLLAGAVLVRGGRIPAPLFPATEALRTGARAASPPLRDVQLRERMAAVAGLTAALVLLTGAGVRAVADDTVLGPAATVRAFAARLAAHDAAGALALVEPGVSGPLLTPAGTSHPPGSVRVVALYVQGDQARADVDEDIDGSTVHATLTLRRHTQKGVFARWLLEAPFTRLRVPLQAAGTTAAIDGVALGDDDSAFVFPGGHTVARRGSGLFQAGSTEVAASGSGEQEAVLPLVLAPGADAVAAAAVRRHVDQCVAAEPVAPLGCPYRDPGNVEDARWSVVKYPIVSTSADGGVVSVSTVADGQVLLTGTTTDAYGEPAPYAEPAPLHVTGSLTWTGTDTSHATFVPEQP